MANPSTILTLTLTLIRGLILDNAVQRTSDLDCFHARDLPCSHVKSHDDPTVE